MDGPTCSRALLSLDDDLGDNEPCAKCDQYFASCTKQFCKQDGSDAEKCAKFCLAGLCQGEKSDDVCKTGPCRLDACPKGNVTNFFDAQPAEPFMTTLFLDKMTVVVTATSAPLPSSSLITVPQLSSSTPTPTPTSPPPPPPKPWTRASRWTLDIIQHMEYEKSEIRWWLIDPNGNNASTSYWDTSKATYRDFAYIDPPAAEGLTMRHNMRIYVIDSLDVNKGRVKLEYMNPEGTRQKECRAKPDCVPYYVTEANDERWQSVFWDCAPFCKHKAMLDNKELSCDPVADTFKHWNAGFERRFKCWWPHDYVDPFWLVPDPK